MEELRPLRSSSGDMVPYIQSSGSSGSISTRHFVYHICLCYSHKIRYLILWHALLKYPTIYTYGQSGHRWWSSIIGGASFRAQTAFMRKNGSSWRSLARKWADMILPSRDNPPNCLDPDKMKMRWYLSTPGSPEYVLLVAQSTSSTPVSPYTRCRSLTMYLEAMIERVERCTWRPRSNHLRDALGGQDGVNSEIHSEAVIDRVWRCTWRPRSSELRNTLGGSDGASLEMDWEAVIKCVWRCTVTPWSSEVGDAIGDRDWVNSEMHGGAVIERVWRCPCRLWSSYIGGVLGSGRFGGRHNGSWDSIHWLTWNCGNVDSWVQQHPPRDGKLARSGKLVGCGRLSVLGWSCTWCILYSVLSHDHCMKR